MIETIRYRLGNGLRVVHNYDASTAMVAVDVLYNVGSRDEDAEMTGLAHLFEHLMFGGSVNVKHFDAEMERAGAMNNAWTSNDFTNFYSYAPAQNFETLLWLESDRMLSLAFSEETLEVQRHVVIEEFKQTHLNRPYGDMMHLLRSLVYKTHPYRYPTIGKEPAHIEKVSLDDIKEFFFSHYSPQNAVLAVSGNVEPDKLRSAVEKWFGDIPSRTVTPRTYEREAPMKDSRELTVKRVVPQTVVMLAYPMPGYGEKGYIECDLITDILSNGLSSRFYRRLILGSDLFASADAMITGSEEPGMLLLQGRLSSPTEEAAREAIERLKSEAMQLCHIADEEHPDGVTQFELDRAVNRYASDFTFSCLNLTERARALAMAEMHGEDINEIVPAYRRVTLEDICLTARKVFGGKEATLIYLSNKDQ